MSESCDRPSLLPEVTEEDILAVGPAELADPENTEAWKRLAQSNPRLATELLQRGFANSRQLQDYNGAEFQQFSTIEIGWVLRVLECAAERVARERAAEIPTAIARDAGDEAQPPAA